MAAPIGAILSLAGAGVSAYGDNKNTQRAAAKKKELQLFGRQLKETIDPLEQSFLTGWSPDGFLRGLAASPGQTQAVSDMLASDFARSSGGSRTSMGSGASETLGFLDAETGADILGAKNLAAMDIRERSKNMPRFNPLANPLAGYGAGLQGLGSSLSQYDSGGSAAKLTPASDPNTNYGPTPSGGNISTGTRVLY
jgi:hypothetical protein